MATNTRQAAEGMEAAREKIVSLEFVGDVMFSSTDRMSIEDARRRLSRNDEHTRCELKRRVVHEKAFRDRFDANGLEVRCVGHTKAVGCDGSSLYHLPRSGLLGTERIGMRQSQLEVERVTPLTDLNATTNRARRIVMEIKRVDAWMVTKAETPMLLLYPNLLLLPHATPSRSSRGC